MSTLDFEDLIFFPDGDTLAIIDPVSNSKPAWTVQPNYCQSIGHRVHSWRLLATGSPIIKHQFEPKTQERNIRRRGGLPEGIRFIIDLTPASTDEDAVLSLTELSCPAGIRTWAASQARWNLPRTLVLGNDYLEEGERQNGRLAEYSPLRHRAGLVHLLQVVEGLSPALNTPCKLWTFFAVAKLYEIATMPEISVRITSWVYEENNRRLIEFHPEIAYRMGKGIQCPHLMQDSFCVLVGEEALLLLRNAGGAPKRSREHQVTVHGRQQDSLDDDDVQRVQYAGESFLAYVLEKFVELAGTEMNWLQDLPMVKNLLNCPREGDWAKIIDDLFMALKDFVRSSIVVRLLQWSETLLAKANNEEPNPNGHYPADKFWEAYNLMTAVERIMTRTFWQHLQDSTLTLSYTTNELIADNHPHLASLGGYMGPFRDQENATLRCVTAVELENKALAFNRFLWINTTGIDETWSNAGSTGRYEFDGAFSLPEFVGQAHYCMIAYAKRMITNTRPGMDYEVTDPLTCLTDAQYRYLPLWAGGCDDGTGGVYADQIPLAEADGFSAPGPSIYTGSAAPSEVPSIASFLDSTVHGASHRATEGFDSEVVSLSSEAFSEEAGPSKSQKVEAELSMTLDSTAEDLDDFSFEYESDGGDTVVAENENEDLDELSDFEELDLNEDEGRELNLPIREKRAIA